VIYECPLCNLEFEEATCHSSCPFSNGCAMVRCPRCAYEFVQEGFIASIFRRLIQGAGRRGQGAGENR
jgi:hypothetical protein